MTGVPHYSARGITQRGFISALFGNEKELELEVAVDDIFGMYKMTFTDVPRAEQGTGLDLLVKGILAGKGLPLHDEVVMLYVRLDNGRPTYGTGNVTLVQPRS